MSPPAEKFQADGEQGGQKSLEDQENLALLMLGPFFRGCRRGLNGDAVLDEGRVQVGIRQSQALVPLPDVP